LRIKSYKILIIPACNYVSKTVVWENQSGVRNLIETLDFDIRPASAPLALGRMALIPYLLAGRDTISMVFHFREASAHGQRASHYFF
jgi:hypothetical protein